MSRDEVKELLGVLNYYLISGVGLGIASASVAVTGGIVLVRTDYGLPLSAKAATALIVVSIGVLTGLLAFLVLLPAELRVVRRKLKPRLLAQRLSGKK
jgi:hypothetical protein